MTLSKTGPKIPGYVHDLSLYEAANGRLASVGDDGS